MFVLYSCFLLDNVFQTLAIFIQSTDTDYLKYQAPWIIGAFLPIPLDGFVRNPVDLFPGNRADVFRIYMQSVFFYARAMYEDGYQPGKLRSCEF